MFIPFKARIRNFIRTQMKAELEANNQSLLHDLDSLFAAYYDESYTKKGIIKNNTSVGYKPHLHRLLNTPHDNLDAVKKQYNEKLATLFKSLNVFEPRHQEIIELMETFRPLYIDNILDIGIGIGGFSKYFAQTRGWKTAGTHTNYGGEQNIIRELEALGVDVIEAYIQDLPFDDNSFDAVFCCHVFEHLYDWDKAFREIRRVLKPHGYLLFCIPRFQEFVTPNHVNTGWNLGLLMHILLINGFYVHDGMFIEYGRTGNNLFAIVKKEDFALPKVKNPGKYGNIHTYSECGLYPVKIYIPPETNPIFDNGFWGDFLSLNWPNPKMLKFYEPENDELYNPPYLKIFK